MRLHTNPILYYCLVPVAIAIWPALVWFKFVPQAELQKARWKQYVPEVNAAAAEILKLEPDRLIERSPQVKEQFDYMTAVSRTAVKCGIPTGSYSHTTGMVTKRSSGQKSQTATVTLKAVSIVQACRFLSTMQVDWPHLECTSINMTQDRGAKDRWTVKLGFEYFYD
ncbi:MAG: hypothetical protein QHH07_01450 [Sedimentisphaerales bacterium]|jgi:hypothetical protein|nr:hypothetical protein [Sedimentisphaerales bacterium]